MLVDKVGRATLFKISNTGMLIGPSLVRFVSLRSSSFRVDSIRNVDSYNRSFQHDWQHCSCKRCVLQVMFLNGCTN